MTCEKTLTSQIHSAIDTMQLNVTPVPNYSGRRGGGLSSKSKANSLQSNTHFFQTVSVHVQVRGRGVGARLTNPKVSNIPLFFSSSPVLRLSAFLFHVSHIFLLFLERCV